MKEYIEQWLVIYPVYLNIEEVKMSDIDMKLQCRCWNKQLRQTCGVDELQYYHTEQALQQINNSNEQTQWPSTPCGSGISDMCSKSLLRSPIVSVVCSASWHCSGMLTVCSRLCMRSSIVPRTRNLWTVVGLQQSIIHQSPATWQLLTVVQR